MRGNGRRAVLRVRVGLGLFVFSWLPIAQVVISVAGMHAAAAAEFRAVVWGAQWTIGLVGLVIAGGAVADVVKHSGWRHTPALLWQMLRTGSVPPDRGQQLGS
jgi:hypothetical protein